MADALCHRTRVYLVELVERVFPAAIISACISSSLRNRKRISLSSRCQLTENEMIRVVERVARQKSERLMLVEDGYDVNRIIAPTSAITVGRSV